MDWALYKHKHRHLVENVFAYLKHFRAIATRYYQGMLAFTCCFMWLPVANVNRPWSINERRPFKPGASPGSTGATAT